MEEEPFSDRLRRLEERLRAADAGRAEPPSRGHREFTQGALAWRMVTELVAGMVIGLAIGYGLDSLLGTLPVFLALFGVLGFAAGVRTLMRTADEVKRGRGGDATRMGGPRENGRNGQGKE